MVQSEHDAIFAHLYGLIYDEYFIVDSETYITRKDSESNKYNIMNDTVKGIIIGVVSGLITSGIVYTITKQFIWELSFPLWMWLIVTSGIVALIYLARIVIRKYRVYNLVSEFNEGVLGDSFVYTWRYKRSKNGFYSAYGYEATDIHTKKPLDEMNNDRVHTCGHEVPEETIKMFIQLILIANIDKKMGEKLKPILEYLNWTENSQIHKLLH